MKIKTRGTTPKTRNELRKEEKKINQLPKIISKKKLKRSLGKLKVLVNYHVYLNMPLV